MAFSKLLKDKRKLTITNDMAKLDGALIGLPLSPFWRRSLAMLVDLFLMALIAIPLLIGLYYAKLRLLNPELYQAAIAVISDSGSDQQKKLFTQLNFEILQLIGREAPEKLPADLAEPFKNGNELLLRSNIDEYSWNYNLTFLNSRNKLTQFNGCEKIANIGPDVIAGNFFSILNIGVTFMLYFTIFNCLLQGATPGKKLLRIRVVRLNGQKMTLYESFGRAGGYSASIATLGFGFLEALWHPNRQTVHDRISSTVVVCQPRKQKLPS